MSDQLITSVLSEGQPQSGQKHRSSGNFSTDNVPDQATQLRWEISQTENPDQVSFDVMEDKSAAKDPTIFSNVTNGTLTKVVRDRRLYIANPEGSNGGSFEVSVYAVD